MSGTLVDIIFVTLPEPPYLIRFRRRHEMISSSVIQKTTCRPGSVPVASSRRSVARRLTTVRAVGDDADEAAFEERLRALKVAKGATPMGEGAKKKAVSETKSQSTQMGSKRDYDFSGETVRYEGTPHRGDLAVNVALGTTIVWLPLTFAAIGRGLFVNYKFTDKRLSVITTAPWKSDQLDVAYQEVADVQVIGRGVGLWGDMVVTLRDGSKVEMRALDQFMELKSYILERRNALGGGDMDNSMSASGSVKGRSKRSGSDDDKGFM